MAVHNGLDLSTKFGVPRLPRGTDFLRFTVNERLQHAVMALSFLVLAYSGFALKFPEAWWAAPFEAVGGGEGTRRLVHRTAAVFMVGVFAYHLMYLASRGRGREQLRALWPRWQDVRDAGQMVAYYLRLRSDRPAFDRFSYIEKAEYWALIWGSLIMTVTGFVLWFENQTLALLPLWVLDLATVVHYYEAWLASLAIAVWHFYWVIFNPEVYPMSTVWLDGGLSEEAMAHEHPKELERLSSGVAPAKDPDASSEDGSR
jgi:formate dehydrogenase gamma subunit